MEDFKQRFAKLNKEQQKAVTNTEGPVMVIAGPGTGKTEIIGMRAAYICKEGLSPAENVLITTFTESGVTAIKKRLLEIMGTDAYKVNITTLHGFCSQVINEFPEKFIFAKGIKQISDIERIEILRNIINSLDLKNLVTFGDRYFYLSDILKSIQKLKREDITPEKLDENLKILEKELKSEHKINPRTGKPTGEWQKKEKQVLKNKELSLIYKEYQKKIKEKGLYDYEDMILFVVNKFKEDDELLASYQEQYLYIMVDEYQDTNEAQNEIISLLTSFLSDEKPNIFVVGDDDQSIYRFQGASLENILFFSDKYGVKSPIVLKQNYRSTQNILDSSFSMIDKNKNRVGNFLDGVDKKLNSQKGEGEKIDVVKFSVGDAEKFYITKKIEKLIEEGENSDEIAIFSRTNRESHEMAEFLIKRDIPVVFEASNNVLQGVSVRAFLDYLSIIENPYDDKKLLDIMSLGFLNIDALDVYKLYKYLYEINYSKKDKVNIFDIISKAENLENLDLISKQNIADFIDKFLKFKKISAETTFTAFCGKVLSDSGFLDWIFNKDEKMEYLRHISSLFSEIKELNLQDRELDTKKFLEKINLYNEYNIEIKEESFLLQKKGVRIMTAHKAKGLEFEYVFITKAVDKTWGNKRSMDKIKLPENLLTKSSKIEFEKNEDERRLFFVALTRAKKKAYITYAEEYVSNGNVQEKSISQFVEEIDKKYINNILGDKEIDDAEEFLDKKLRGSKIQKEKEDEYLKSLLADYKLSVTHLDNYLECPRKFKFRNLIRIPEAKNKHMVLGTAYHKALEKFFLEFKNTDKLPSSEFLVSAYKNAIEREILTYKEKEELTKIGAEGILGYYNLYKDSMIVPEAVEYNFSKHEVYLDDVHLTGKIDKIEKVNTTDVKVIDYKTGSAKTKNQIEGKTKDSKGNLKRQIVFYKILCDLDSRFKYNMTVGELDFVQGKDEKYKKETVEFTEKDVSELKETIKEVYEKIMNSEFECSSKQGFCDGCKDYK